MPSENFDRLLSVSSDPETSWAVLTDVARLAGWVSIIEDVQQKSHLESYSAILSDRLGPFKLRADLEVSVSEVDEPHRIRVRAHGEDRQVASRISIDATLTIEPRADGTSGIHVTGVYEVIGRVATLGAGTIRQKATKILDEFTTHAERALGTP